MSLGDRRLLGNDEGLGHEGLQSNPVMAGFASASDHLRGARNDCGLWNVPGLCQLNKIFSGQLFDQALQFEPQVMSTKLSRSATRVFAAISSIDVSVASIAS